MAISKRDWPKQTWRYPMPHDFTFGFGLDMDEAAATKNSTIVPYLFQDNALVDYETIKTNPENADFTVESAPNVRAGSYIPKIMVAWRAFSHSDEVKMMNFKYMDITTAMLNRLDAFDKKTGNDIETILELTHETGDEQVYPLWNGTKLYEGHSVNDLSADVPGLTTTQQPEGVAFDMEMYFDALHYYTNKEMLRQVTSKMRSYTLGDEIKNLVPKHDRFVSFYNELRESMCKFQHPYTGCFGLFHCPQAGTHNQPAKAAAVTAIEHLTVLGRVRFNEYNPDFNFSRA